MEIRDTGEYAHRRTTITDAKADLDAGSMTEAVLKACDHASRDVKNKRRAMNYLETHVPGHHVEQVAELLATPHVSVEYEATVTVGESD